MTNREFIQDLGLTLTGNVRADNKMFAQQIADNVPNKFVKYVKINGKYKKFTLSPISFEIGFCEQIWSQLNIYEKLQLTKWASEDYLQRNGYGVDFPDFVYFSENNFDNISFVALALRGKILVSLDFLNRANGYDAYILAIHESIHELDFKFAKQIMDDVISKYVFQYKSLDNFRTLREIMKLPVQGKIINWQTGKYEFVTDKLREQILLCKNFIITICKLKNTPSGRNYIYSSADFDKYLTSDFYYLSPLENRAYNESIMHIFKMAIANAQRIDYSPSDIKTLDKYYDYLLNINGRKREIQKHYKMPACFAVNMELEYLFNRYYYGNATINYICKNDMVKRAEAIKYFWNMKHCGKGEYISEFRREVMGRQ